jgi:hypothetical protein
MHRRVCGSPCGILFSLPIERHFIVDDKIVLLKQSDKNLWFEVAEICGLCHKFQVPFHKVLAHL